MEAIHSYNNLLSNADAAGNQIDHLEREVRDLNERIFTGVATIFGRDSDEYEMVGGARKSEIAFGPQDNGEAEPETFDPATDLDHEQQNGTAPAEPSDAPDTGTGPIENEADPSTVVQDV